MVLHCISSALGCLCLHSDDPAALLRLRINLTVQTVAYAANERVSQIVELATVRH